MGVSGVSIKSFILPRSDLAQRSGQLDVGHLGHMFSAGMMPLAIRSRPERISQSKFRLEFGQRFDAFVIAHFSDVGQFPLKCRKPLYPIQF